MCSRSCDRPPLRASLGLRASCRKPQLLRTAAKPILRPRLRSKARSPGIFPRAMRRSLRDYPARSPVAYPARRSGQPEQVPQCPTQKLRRKFLEQDAKLLIFLVSTSTLKSKRIQLRTLGRYLRSAFRPYASTGLRDGSTRRDLCFADHPHVRSGHSIQSDTTSETMPHRPNDP